MHRTADNSAIAIPPPPAMDVATDYDDSPAVILRELERERGRLFSDAEYREMREMVIEELARGPHPRLSTQVTLAVVGLLLLAFTVVGIWMVARGTVNDYTLAICGLAACGVWGFFVHGFRRAMREHSCRSLDERLAELDTLRVGRLLTDTEYHRISAAVHLARQTRQGRMFH